MELDVDQRRKRFIELHKSGTFVMPNPFDAGTAKLLEASGFFRAVATTSAGFAFSQGLPDSMTSLTLDEVLQHQRSIVASTNLPVNADFQNGYAKEGDYETLKRNIQRCAETGVSGLSIEDVNSVGQLFSFEEAVQRVRVAREALSQCAPDVVLTARCEAFLIGIDDIDEVLRRLVAYSQAGADVLYAPHVFDRDKICRIVASVRPKPVNILVSSGSTGLTVAELTQMGVRRISIGSALARVALRAFIDAAQEIGSKGTFTCFEKAVPFGHLNKAFASASAKRNN